MSTRKYAVAALTAGALVCTSAIGASAAPPTDTSALREAVTVEAVRAHQAEFQEFADLSGGTREASTLGYTLSADYVAGLMTAAGYEVTRQQFEYNFYEELAAASVLGTSPGFPFTYTDGVNISTMDYSGSGTVSGVVQGVNDNIVPLPVGAARWHVERRLRRRRLRRVHRRHRIDPARNVRLLRQDRQRHRRGRRRRDHLQRRQQRGALRRSTSVRPASRRTSRSSR